ncbi:MAG: hypothetical protein K8T25_08530 [Planctomycetia bacterium]|nr:hypothetical protein [Planctomycetia bacterium]
MSPRLRRIVILGIIAIAGYGLGFTAALFAIGAWANAVGYYGDGVLAGTVVTGCLAGIGAFVVGDHFLTREDRRRGE